MKSGIYNIIMVSKTTQPVVEQTAPPVISWRGEHFGKLSNHLFPLRQRAEPALPKETGSGSPRQLGHTAIMAGEKFDSRGAT